MKYHYVSFHLQKRFQCKFCPRVFASLKTFRYHQDHMHQMESDAPNTFLCPVEGCAASYSCQQNLNRHNREKHTGKKWEPKPPTPCPICQEPVMEMLKHKVEKHGDPGLKLPCLICGEIFPMKIDRNAHMRTVHPKEAAETGLFTSCRKKLAPTEISCPHCHKIFRGEKVRTTLRIHIRGVHEKVRYPCSVCDRSYYSQKDMLDHVRAVHEGIKMACRSPGCTMKFGRTSDRNRHERNVHGGVVGERQFRKANGESVVGW